MTPILPSGDITTHYSAAELTELLDAAEKVVDRGASSPTFTVIQREVSENCRKQKGARSLKSG